ncbi:hypothetical protein BDY19DRAFT_364424 [Irpex rosettiformis]|uniref:Uncharacterized protein n=1 Tax=Irpex rosettiformis TaxID=378272 RepID=A0ACB8TW44_9APHY|nr:hypothetical protein BDY19DRAFT_364424 [Irpex rosettiformis]
MACPGKDPTLRHTRLKKFDYGLWRVVYEDSTRKPRGWVDNTLARIRQIRDTPVLRFCRDVYSVDPPNSILCVVSRFLSGIEQSLLVSWSTKVFGLIEAGYSSGKINRKAILAVLLTRVGLSLFTVIWRRWTTHADSVLETQVRMHYQEQLLKGWFSQRTHFCY